jgi:hypothetical protein
MIKISKLKTGIYVQLPKVWRAHPFLRNSFAASSPKQIAKMKEYGILEVNINFGKSSVHQKKFLPEEQPQKYFSVN